MNKDMDTLSSWLRRWKACDSSFERQLLFTEAGKSRKYFPQKAVKGYVKELKGFVVALRSVNGFDLALYYEGLMALDSLADMVTGEKGLSSFVTILRVLRHLIGTIDIQSKRIVDLENEIKELIEKKLSMAEDFLQKSFDQMSELSTPVSLSKEVSSSSKELASTPPQASASKVSAQLEHSGRVKNMEAYKRMRGELTLGDWVLFRGGELLLQDKDELCIVKEFDKQPRDGNSFVVRVGYEEGDDTIGSIDYDNEKSEDTVASFKDV